MISLDSVGEDYVSHEFYPIDFVTDAGSCWGDFFCGSGRRFRDLDSSGR